MWNQNYQKKIQDYTQDAECCDKSSWCYLAFLAGSVVGSHVGLVPLPYSCVAGTSGCIGFSFAEIQKRRDLYKVNQLVSELQKMK